MHRGRTPQELSVRSGLRPSPGAALVDGTMAVSRPSSHAASWAETALAAARKRSSKRCAALRIEPRVPMREPGFADQLAGGPDSIARQELTDGTIVSTACFTSKSWVLHNAAYNLRRAPPPPSLFPHRPAPPPRVSP